MQTDTILNGILALLVADRDRSDGRSTTRILAEAGLTGEHIAMLTGRDPDRPAEPPATAFGQHAQPSSSSVIASSMTA
jgi:hypothetical protein